MFTSVIIIVLSVFTTAHNQVVKICTDFRPQPHGNYSAREADIANFENFFNVVFEPNSTLTQAQITDMVVNLIPTLSCQSRAEIAKWRRSFANISLAAQSLYTEKIKPIKDNGSLTYLQERQLTFAVLHNITDSEIYDELSNGESFIASLFICVLCPKL